MGVPLDGIPLTVKKTEKVIKQCTSPKVPLLMGRQREDKPGSEPHSGTVLKANAAKPTVRDETGGLRPPARSAYGSERNVGYGEG